MLIISPSKTFQFTQDFVLRHRAIVDDICLDLLGYKYKWFKWINFEFQAILFPFIHRNSSYQNILNDWTNDLSQIEAIVSEEITEIRNKYTVFHYEDGILYVSKLLLIEGELTVTLREKVVEGIYLTDVLSKKLIKGKVEDFENILAESITKVYSNFGSSKEQFLIGKCVDCIARNTIVTRTGYQYFDKEFDYTTEISKSHFIFRSVVGYNRSGLFPWSWPYNSQLDLYLRLCNKLNVEERLEEDIQAESTFLRHVFGVDSELARSDKIREGFLKKRSLFIVLVNKGINCLQVVANYLLCIR